MSHSKCLFVLSNSEAEIRIEDCVVEGGAKFRASTKVAWEKPMYLVETEDGTYISSTIMEHQHAKSLPCGSPIKWLDGYVGRKLNVCTKPKFKP
jgi:hypothetical protein